MKTGRYTHGAGLISRTAMFTALSFLFLYGASVTPSGQVGVVAAAGLFPGAAVVSGRYASGWFCYGATGLLALLLVPDKGSVLLYLIFFGLYPILKHLMERLNIAPLVWLCKLAVCNAALALFWFLLRTILLAQLPQMFESLWVFWLAGNVIFILYDFGFSRLMKFYLIRIHRAMK